jgi:DNA-binding response OmpR family regulator
MKAKILIIEDNTDIADLIRLHLEDLNFDSQIANTGEIGLRLFKTGQFDLVILDLMLPIIDGLTVCKQLRRQDQRIPVIMLTSKSSEIDRVLGLELGADDYLTKPFSLPELMARIKVQLRRLATFAKPNSQPKKILQRGKLVINPDTHTVTHAGKMIELTAREFELLHHFASHPGRVYSRMELLDQVWGYHYEGYEHTVNSHINRLRNKIETLPSQPDFIITVWGVGYKFNEQLH